MDQELCRRLEPGTPPPRRRLEAMERLVQAGVNSGVLLAPIIPGITDGDDDLREVVREAAGHGARFLGSNALFLKEGTKEHFLSFLEQEYPRMAGAYRNLYPGAFMPWDMKDRIQKRVANFQRIYGLNGRREGPEIPDRTRQLQLAL